MAGFFRRRGRDPKPSAAVAGEEVSSEPAGESALTFEPPRRGAALPARRARTDAEDGTATEVARLREELRREQLEKARALAEAERRLVRALAEQRTELEAEARERVAEVTRLREELARERAEIEAELATTRRKLEDTEPYLAALAQPSAQIPRG